MFTNTSDSLFWFPAFPVKVRELLLRCHEIGHVVRGELDDRVLEDLKALPERGERVQLPRSSFHPRNMFTYQFNCCWTQVR